MQNSGNNPAEDLVREVKYEKVISGQRAKYALEELDEFLKEHEQALLHKIVSAPGPNEAWQVIVQYRAAVDFVNLARSEVMAGEMANEYLQEE